MEAPRAADGVIELRMAPQEIIDHVDEMLAWLAISSECKEQRYVVNHLYRAEPMIRLGNGVHGELFPDSICVAEDSDEGRSLRDVLEEQDQTARLLPRWLSQTKRVAYARLTECAPMDEVAVVMQQRLDRGGDDVKDLCLDDDPYGHQAFIGVRYHLSSVGDANEPTRRLIVSRAGLPQAARVLLLQEILTFEDGRARCDHGYFATWNGRFFDLQKRPLGLRVGDHGVFSPELAMLTHAAMDALVRETDWVVELALSPKRTGIGLRTDALGAREFVNMLRGSDTVAGRRKSLVHWVQQHMRRKSRLDTEATVNVAAHLRGLSGLDAGRYHARIWPATRDIERAKNGHRFDHANKLGVGA